MSLWRTRAPQVQGIYFVATGLWPYLHLESFLALTGPKTDIWLVRTVGALITVTGAALLRAVARGELNSSFAWLMIGQSVGLALIEVVYVLNDTISPIYAADAVVELAFAASWAWFVAAAVEMTNPGDGAETQLSNAGRKRHGV